MATDENKCCYSCLPAKSEGIFYDTFQNEVIPWHIFKKKDIFVIYSGMTNISCICHMIVLQYVKSQKYLAILMDQEKSIVYIRNE